MDNKLKPKVCSANNTESKNLTDDPQYFKNYYQRNKDKMKENSRLNYLKKKGIIKDTPINLIISNRDVFVSFD